MSLTPVALAPYAFMNSYVVKQATGHYAVSEQILTFWLVTLKVAHQFDVLVDVMEAFQLLTVVNNFHWVIKNLRWLRMEEKVGKQWRDKNNPDSDSVSSSKKAQQDSGTCFAKIWQAINWEIISSRTS